MTRNPINCASLVYIIFVSAIVQLGVSIGEILLDENVEHVFRNVKIQYPGSGLFEWMWVPLHPDNIDYGPSIGILTAGASSIVSAVATLIWILLIWWALAAHIVRPRWLAYSS